MISIFATLAIVSLFEISPSKATPINDVRRVVPPKPDEVLMQMANVVNSAPEIMCAIADLEPNKIARMTPHLNELTRILAGNPLGELFEYLKNLCAHHEELQQIKRVQRHIDQFVQQNAGGGAPITIKNKTKVKLVYAPRYDSRPTPQEDGARAGNVPDAATRQFADEVTGDKVRVAREALEDLRELRNKAKTGLSQLSEQLVRGNEDLKTLMREVETATRKEMADAIDSLEAEKRKSFDDVKNAIGWLRRQTDEQMAALNAELEAKKKSYRSNVDELVSEVRASLDKEDETVTRRVSEATELLRRRVADANSQLGEQLGRARTGAEEEVEKAAKDIEARVEAIREKMRAAVGDLKKDMEKVDAELKRSVADAVDGAKTSAANSQSQSQAEMAKAVAEMKKATREMREQMENEIRSKIRELSAEIESILTDMRNATSTRTSAIGPAAPASRGSAAATGQATADALLAPSGAKSLTDNGGRAGTGAHGDFDSQPDGTANQADQHDDLEFEDDFEDDDLDGLEK